MQFSIVLALIYSFAGVTSWRIPSNSPDGVYSVHVRPDGTEEHLLLNSIPSNPSPNLPLPRRYHISKLDASTITSCYPEEGTDDLPHDSFDSAASALDAQCGHGTPVRQFYDFYSIYGCVVAYFCHFHRSGRYGSNAPTNCSATENLLMRINMKEHCGLYKPGAVGTMRHHDDGHLDSWAWYGFESYCTDKGRNFCGRGVDYSISGGKEVL